MAGRPIVNAAGQPYVNAAGQIMTDDCFDPCNPCVPTVTIPCCSGPIPQTLCVSTTNGFNFKIVWNGTGWYGTSTDLSFTFNGLTLGGDKVAQCLVFGMTTPGVPLGTFCGISIPASQITCSPFSFTMINPCGIGENITVSGNLAKCGG